MVWAWMSQMRMAMLIASEPLLRHKKCEKGLPLRVRPTERRTRR